jgi:DNA-binding transcriptional ArsR family regulator
MAVRLRRDFNLVLALIRAHAFLHQANRERDQDGCIIAVLDDYVVVRGLVAELISEGVEATVPETVREIVDAVVELSQDSDEGVSLTKIAAKLDLDKSAVSRRVRKAEKAGYVKNLEERRGKPARIRTADPLPDDIQLLPEPDAIADRCTVDANKEGIETPSPPRTSDENERLMLDEVTKLIVDGVLIETSKALRWAPRPGEPAEQSDVLTIELGRLVPNTAFCRHPDHRDSDWQTTGGRTVCGICHPSQRSRTARPMPAEMGRPRL